MRSKSSRKVKYLILALVCFCMTGCSDGAADVGGLSGAQPAEQTQEESLPEDTSENVPSVSGDEIPAYEGEPYVTVNGNEPEFDDGLLKEESFEEYGSLDKYGRCTTATACLSTDTQPGNGEARGDISSVHPSGWRSGEGWERCHLIGWQLSGENDNARNLVTGTHYMNVSGMLPFENDVEWYISETGNHVLYEVTPVYEGKNLICSGVQMQAESVEDKGKGISFNVFCFNVAPGKTIDYKTGETKVTDEDVVSENSFSRVYILNTNTMKFHYPTCSSVADMAEHNKKEVTCSREELIDQGYSPCGNCEP